MLLRWWKQRRTDAAQLARVKRACRTSRRGGFFKLLDQNREHLQFLQDEGLLQKYPWLECWLEDQDILLINLLKALGADQLLGNRKEPYPLRSWPGKTDLSEVYMRFKTQKIEGKNL